MAASIVDWGDILPRLQRFYGGSPAWWLAEAPVALVSAYAMMLPRLQAAEQLDRVRAGALASGGYDKHDSRAMLDELQSRAAGHFAGEAGAGSKPRMAGPEALAAMGIGVIVMPPVHQEQADV